MLCVRINFKASSRGHNCSVVPKVVFIYRKVISEIKARSGTGRRIGRRRRKNFVGWDKDSLKGQWWEETIITIIVIKEIIKWVMHSAIAHQRGPFAQPIPSRDHPVKY